MAARNGLARRGFQRGGAFAAVSLLVPRAPRAAQTAEEDLHYDFIVVGAGTAGIPAAIFAA